MKMAVLQMQKINICGLKKDRKSILEILQSSGVMEVTKTAEEDSVFQKMDTMSYRQMFEKNALLADQALEILQNYAPEKKSLLAGLEGKALEEATHFKRMEKECETILKSVKQILGYEKKIAESKASILKVESQIEGLTPWLNLDIPMKFSGTKKSAVLIGTMTETVTLEQIYEAVAEKEPSLDAFDVTILGTDKDQTCIVAVCLKKDATKLEDALRAVGFARPSQAVGEIPAQQVEEWKNQIQGLKAEVKSLEEQIRAYKDQRKDFEMLSDYYRIRAQKYQVLGDLLQSKKTFLVTGYVPQKDVAQLEEKLVSRYDLAFEQEEIAEEEQPPVLLKNNAVAESAEGVTASFGLPAKGEMDPTSVMALCYIFLFGLMLSDAAYGFIVSLACFIVLKKYKRMESGLRKSIKLFMYCGISTLFWGVMFGGYFGDALDVIARTFFGREVTTPIIPALWFIPLNNPMKLLVYSMLFGTIHLYLGLGMKGYMLLKDKKYLDFVCDVVFWFLLLTGLIFILLPTELFGSIAQMSFVFPPIVGTLAKAFAIVGAVGIVFMSGRSSKNPALRIALGAYDLYNITGWVSDVLSYSRLLALGLATGVIASVINQMGSMLGNNLFGIIGFIIVFIGGHIFNLGINILGAYVHTCRLQYVEFFGKFYEGGGRMFQPFCRKTKYVEFKED